MPPWPSTLTAILARHGELNPGDSPKHRRLQRFEMFLPNQLWQMDFKGPIEMANAQACHPLKVLDDHSRFLAGLRACRRQQGRTLRSELLNPRTILDLEDGRRQFVVWREVYTTQRPHEALGLQPPRKVSVPSPWPFPDELPPIEYEPGAIVRMTDCAGRLQYQGQRFRMGKAFRDSLVALRAGSRAGVWAMYFCQQRIAQIRLTRLQP